MACCTTQEKRNPLSTPCPGRRRPAPPIVHEVLRAPGTELDRPVRAFAEGRFALDFSKIRIHNDSRASQSAEAVNAVAYTVGSHIAFRSGSYAPETDAGRRLLLHELTHAVQQRGVGAEGASSPIQMGPTDDPLEREADASRIRPSMVGSRVLQRTPAGAVCFEGGVQPPTGCNPREPERCETYEMWLASFQGVRTFSSRDTTSTGVHPTGKSVLGESPASHSPQAAAGVAPPLPGGGPNVADHFIDHPTDQWVRSCLPENLRSTAYLLRSDCADIAVILRHVWLAAHHRTEKIGSSGHEWTIGDTRGGAAQGNIATVIREVFTGNVAGMINPYLDARGTPIRSFDALQHLVHPGDVLVWEHHSGGLGTARTGGHTMTIVGIDRNRAGGITGLHILQGNQPIFQEQAQEIRAEVGRGAPSERVLRDAPGRRIEANELRSGSLRDLLVPPGAANAVPVWTWGDGNTTLVAAGPPRAAARPRARRGARRVTDWVPPLRAATLATLPGVLESALMEVRGEIEGGRVVTETDARAIAVAAGERLWRLARDAHGLGEESHFRPLEQLQAVIHALASSTAQPARHAEVLRTFDVIERAFVEAARGMTSVDFSRSRAAAGMRTVNMLVTGFDPFNTADVSRPPRAGEWNPSGAAVLELDGATVPVSRTRRASVEGVVFPVSFDEFGRGMVENLLRAHTGSRTSQPLDAVLTVSEDPNIPAGDPVRLEQFVVGVHRRGGVLESIPAAPGGGGRGPAILPASAPVRAISAEAGTNVGTEITFRFASEREANRALRALSLPRQGSATVRIDDPTAIQQITSTMTRSAGGVDIEFRVGHRRFQAAVVRGPGGSFLSNEISYRTLRELAASGGSNPPPSVHVHTQTGSVIPTGPAGASARTAAFSVKNALVATLRRIIRAIASRLP
jgi:Domain of unknown function (DUF4157)